MKFWITLFAVILSAFPQQVCSDNSGNILGKILKIAVPAALLLNDKTAEKLIGQIGSSQIESEKTVVNDPAITIRPNNVFLKVSGKGERIGKYSLKILNDNTVNAYAVPDGHIYLNRGLVQVPGISTSEIAAVLGHEISHVDKRHGLKQLKEKVAIGLVAGKVSAKGQAGTLLALGGQLYTSGRSQKDEKEADILGAQCAATAGFDPQGSLTFMRRLETMQEYETRINPNSAVSNWLKQRLQTHPPTSERCDYLKDWLFKRELGSDYRITSSQIVAQVFSQPALGKWYTGTIHLHSTYSDASRSIMDCAQTAKKAGSSFLILTDHFEQINQPGKMPKLLKKPYGIEEYIDGCRFASQLIPVIPGAEIESKWKPEQDATQFARSHTLCFPIDSQIPEDSGLLFTDQQSVLQQMDHNGKISIAAHPNWINKGTMPISADDIWKQIKLWGDFRYDLRPANENSAGKPIGQVNYNQLCGVEFFNVEKREQNQGVLDAYLRLVNEGRNVAVTAGNDSHGWEIITDRTAYRFTCQTGIFGDCTQEGIIQAMKLGRTCAFACGPKLISIDPIPGFAYQNVSNPVFKLVLTKPKLLKMPEMLNISWEKIPKMMVYSSGKMVANVPPKVTSNQIIYQWVDKSSQTGQKRYILWVPNIFVSSPISLNITKSAGNDKFLIDQGPRHLGDDQETAHTLWWKEFSLTTADLANRTSAAFKFRVKGTPRKDPIISINRQKIGSAITRTGQWEWFEFETPLNSLRPGKNLLDIETVIADLRQTFDDCEFAECWLVFN